MNIRRSSSWFSVALLLALKGAQRMLRKPPAGARHVKRLVVLYGAFKGMGDLICAAPVIASELNGGVTVILLVFPQLRGFVDLIEFGSNRKHLQIVVLPVAGGFSGVAAFLRRMASLSPDLVWYSPHAPRVVSSWKIPLLLWITARRYWPTATLAGAESERLSWLFNIRIPVDRRLPYGVREWTAYTSLDDARSPRGQPAIAFKDTIQRSREMPRTCDILIHPGASAENRKWPLGRYAELLERIPAVYRIAILGLPQDIGALKSVLPRDREIRFSSGSIEEAIISIAGARVALTMDSGTMFFAKLLGVPTVTLFGPSDPAAVIPASGKNVQVYDVKWSCQPCGSTRCSQKAVYCMSSIEPARVAGELLCLLEHET